MEGSRESVSLSTKNDLNVSKKSQITPEKKTFDGLLIHHLGQFGRYQCFLFLSLAVSSVAATWHNLIQVFTGVTPEFLCAGAGSNNRTGLASSNVTQFIDQSVTFYSLLNQSRYYREDVDGDYFPDLAPNSLNISTLGQCDIVILNADSPEQGRTVSCTYWEYDTEEYASTIVTEWDLVCTSRWLPSLAQSLHMLGCMVGTLLWGELSDRFGRRPVLLMTSSITIAAGISTAFVTSFELYTFLRFLVGVSVSGQFNAAYIISIELVGPRWRGIAGIIMMNLCSLSIMIMAGFAYLVRNWRHLQLVVSAPLAIQVTYFLVAPESPRWLLVNKKMKGAKKLIEQLAKYNGKKLPDDYKDWLTNTGETHESSGRRYGMLDLFRTLQLRIKTVTVVCLWFVIAVTYYGLSLYTSDLGGNIYLNFFLSGAVEVPAYCFSMWCLKRFGRRSSLSLSMVLSGSILLLTSPFGDDHAIVRIALSMCGKMCISVAYVIVYPFSVELFPTVIRSVGLGVVSIGARIGGFVAPYILLLGQRGKSVPLVVCGCSAFIGGLLALMMPETANRELPETIEDAEDMRIMGILEIIRRMKSKKSTNGTPKSIILEPTITSGPETATETKGTTESTSSQSSSEMVVLLDIDESRANDSSCKSESSPEESKPML